MTTFNTNKKLVVSDEITKNKQLFRRLVIKTTILMLNTNHEGIFSHKAAGSRK